jgi:hypothetical protein
MKILNLSLMLSMLSFGSITSMDEKIETTKKVKKIQKDLISDLSSETIAKIVSFNREGNKGLIYSSKEITKKYINSMEICGGNVISIGFNGEEFVLKKLMESEYYKKGITFNIRMEQYSTTNTINEQLKKILENNEAKNKFEFDFSYNNIEFDEAMKIVKLVKTNKYVTSIDLSGNKIGDDVVEEINEELKKSKSITSIDLRWNSNVVINYDNTIIIGGGPPPSPPKYDESLRRVDLYKKYENTNEYDEYIEDSLYFKMPKRNHESKITFEPIDYSSLITNSFLKFIKPIDYSSLITKILSEDELKEYKETKEKEEKK